MCHLHFCKRAVCACCTCEFYGTLLQTGISPYFAYGIAANLEKKGPKISFWTGLLPLNDLYIDNNIWAAWNMPFFNLQRDTLSRVQF